MVDAKGYCTQDDVESLLGASLTSAQEGEFTRLLPVAEAYIDSRTGRSWLDGAVTDEAYFNLAGPLLWLHGAPLASSTVTVKVRGSSQDTERTLVAGTDYDVEDVQDGRLRLSGWRGYQRVRVSYTPSSAVDARVMQAGRQLVAFWMSAQHSGAEEGVKSLTFGQDLKIDFDRTVSERGIPPEVDGLLDSLSNRFGVFA